MSLPHIMFLLPGPGHNPIGGYKVVYEYANGLARQGYRVTVVHPAILDRQTALRNKARGYYWFGRRTTQGSYKPNTWFSVDPRVSLRWTLDLAEKRIPDADIVVATAWQTAEWAAGYSARKGRKLYLIQHMETWSGAEERVMATWRLPVRKIVIARWLADIAMSLGETCDYIPNGLDFAAFGRDEPPEQRNEAGVMMLFHPIEWKGSVDGLAALERVQHAIPELRVTLFGVPEPPPCLKPWITYHRKPAQVMLRRLYNESAIFLAPSWAEGWPLPPAEAMMCGSALVATDIGGHREYALDGKTALLIPPRDVEAMATAVTTLIRQPTRRVELAEAGSRFIAQFTWDRAVASFIDVIRREMSLQPTPTGMDATQAARRAAAASRA